LKIIADFHIHSHFSIATSKDLIPESLEYWARLKGINVVGTGDCAHPGWLKELKEKLEPAGNGLLRLKADFRRKDLASPTDPCGGPYFILTGEISSIYKKDGKVRKVHNLCVFPDFPTVEKFQNRLARIGNIESDGRPILGLDSKRLLEMVLESSDSSFLIPAHIWTPWFSALGSKSGFDRLEECFDDLTPHIFAVETGLSSDPPMNWACPFLDRFSLVSNSDAHSPEKLGREANLFDTGMSYPALHGALKGGVGFIGTIEFFPQLGKYHYDGHRKCGVCWDPMETIKHKGICPECGKPVTKGVMYRVAELAERSDLDAAPNKRDFYSITPLPDLIAEIQGKKSSSSKSVKEEYHRLIGKLGPEFHVLLFSPLEEILRAGGELFARGIEKLRNGDLIIEDGFDGEFGQARVFDAKELRSLSGASLFAAEPQAAIFKTRKAKGSIEFDIDAFQKLHKKLSGGPGIADPSAGTSAETHEQREGIEHFKGPCMVLAGPGSGKTKVLTDRIIHLITKKGIDPARILALTFSNKAAQEMAERVGRKWTGAEVRVSTFHAFGLSVLRERLEKFNRRPPVHIVDEEEKREIVERISGAKKREIQARINEIEMFKQGGYEKEIPSLVELYGRELEKSGAFDLDDLIYLPLRLFREDAAVQEDYRRRYPWILIDEFQDINAAQYQWIMALAGEGSVNLFVIGDPDQAIYGFRGSDVRLMGQFQRDYPGHRLITLSVSYRCPASFLKVAGQALGKVDFPEGRPEDRKVHIQQCETESSEADWIATQIEKMMGGVRSFSMYSGLSDGDTAEGAESFSDFAVLCRTSAMFGPLEKAFADHGIACQVVGTRPFYEAEPWKSIINRLRRTFFHGDRGGEGAQNPLETELRRRIEVHADVWEILKFMAEGTEISDSDRERMKSFAEECRHDFERFFLSTATRLGMDDYDKRAEAVSLMTLHASKGLEFNVVFIPGCEEGIIPFELFGKKKGAELEEEARLFYVGITRSKKYLFLSHAAKRFFRGRVLRQKKSSFIDRMEKGLIFRDKREARKSIGPDSAQLPLFQ
jgi:uncharacterized protein (TIGR00375 family)